MQDHILVSKKFTNLNPSLAPTNKRYFFLLRDWVLFIEFICDIYLFLFYVKNSSNFAFCFKVVLNLILKEFKHKDLVKNLNVKKVYSFNNIYIQYHCKIPKILSISTREVEFVHNFILIQPVSIFSDVFSVDKLTLKAMLTLYVNLLNFDNPDT